MEPQTTRANECTAKRFLRGENRMPLLMEPPDRLTEVQDLFFEVLHLFFRFLFRQLVVRIAHQVEHYILIVIATMTLVVVFIVPVFFAFSSSSTVKVGFHFARLFTRLKAFG
ncbi:hypothetical protein TNCV_4562901 [Trichonephila clavipes]|uniref:Transmembrane protein n=1 Tax=Trichonephila clavipes TaxID=2585209 RepID=A0A8X6W4Y3_TRICX|nr:hypothetical protein TNCV_4562901 [Trichonephila clavipes]